jgi:hypothetical protein
MAIKTIEKETKRENKHEAEQRAASSG